MIRKVFTLAILAAALTACHKEEIVPLTSTPRQPEVHRDSVSITPVVQNVNGNQLLDDEVFPAGTAKSPLDGQQGVPKSSFQARQSTPTPTEDVMPVVPQDY